MHTQLGPPDDKQNITLERLTESTANLCVLVDQLFSDQTITITDGEVKLDTTAIESELDILIALTDGNQFEFNSCRNVYEDIVLFESTISSDMHLYMAGIPSKDEILARLLEKIHRVKMNIVNSPERVIAEETERAHRELEEVRIRQNTLEKAKRELKPTVIGLSNLLAEIGTPEQAKSFSETVKFKNLIETLEGRGIEITRLSLSDLLEERLLEALQEIERGSRDTHIFRYHGDSLTIEDMNNLLGIKGRNPNRNRTYQSKFINNIFIAKAIIQNLEQLQGAIERLKNKFIQYHPSVRDNRGRVNSASEEEIMFTSFDYTVGQVYPTIATTDGTMFVDESNIQDSSTVLVCLRYTRYPQQIEEKETDGYQLSIETMYPVIVK